MGLTRGTKPDTYSRSCHIPGKYDIIALNIKGWEGILYMENLAWNYMVELRKEILESQKIRAQVIGFKITFISAGLGLLIGNINRIPGETFAIPALAAIFFDFLINSYSFSIKRLGFYIRNHIEPALISRNSCPEDYILWEKFMGNNNNSQYLSIIGNLGITTITVTIAVSIIIANFHLFASLPLILAIVGFFIYDVIAYVKVKKKTFK